MIDLKGEWLAGCGGETQIFAVGQQLTEVKKIPVDADEYREVCELHLGGQICGFGCGEQPNGAGVFPVLPVGLFLCGLISFRRFPECAEECAHLRVMFFELFSVEGEEVIGGEEGFAAFGEVFHGIGHGVGADDF